jgi:hypothetical protein
MMRRIAFLAASLLVSACGLLVGIDQDLTVKSHDGGTDAKEIGDAVDASDDDAFDATIDYDAAAYPKPRRPPEGTYTYDVSGSDKIQGAFVYNPASYGPTATVTIKYVGSDCYEQKMTLRQDYDETMRFCIKGLDLVMDLGTRYQKFAIGATAQTTETCNDIYFSTAPTLGPWKHECKGQNTDDKTGNSAFTVSGIYTFVGDEMISVFGTSVDAHHFHDPRDVAGSQKGTNVSDWWLAVDDASIVRFKRDIDVTYDSPVGKITYTERVTNMLVTSKPLPSDAGAD